MLLKVGADQVHQGPWWAGLVKRLHLTILLLLGAGPMPRGQGVAQRAVQLPQPQMTAPLLLALALAASSEKSSIPILPLWSMGARSNSRLPIPGARLQSCRTPAQHRAAAATSAAHPVLPGAAARAAGAPPALHRPSMPARAA